MSAEKRWPIRVRLAHWVLELISPWLSETPYEEPEEWDGDTESDRAYDAGMQDGYEKARDDQARYGDGRW